MQPPQPLRISFGWTWFSQTWLLFSKARLFIFGLAILSGFLSVFVNIVPVIGKVAGGFFYPLIMGGGIHVLAEIDKGRPRDINGFFVPITDSSLFKKYLPLCFVCTGLMFATTIIAGILVFVVGNQIPHGSSIPVIPGIPGITASTLLTLIGALVTITMSLVMAVLCIYAPALIELEGVSARTAMEQSIVLTSRNWLPFLVLGFVYLIPGLVPLLPGAAAVFLAMTGGLSWLIAIALLVFGGLITLVLMIPLSFCLPYIIYRETFYPEQSGSELPNQPLTTENLTTEALTTKERGETIA